MNDLTPEQIHQEQIQVELQNLLYAMEMDPVMPPEIYEQRMRRIEELRSQLLGDQYK